jgi:hypothetical protein
MAERNSDGGGSSSFNLNSLLALLTLAGSLWLVSHKLTSDRPVIPAAGPRDSVGEQTLAARLWEDPFKIPDGQGGRGDEAQTETNLNAFLEQIRERSQSPNQVLLLPVMLSGGNYGEDQESRIRSRFAIVSALGRSGYAPEDAEHVGTLTIPWPGRQEVERAKQRTKPVLANLWTGNKPFGTSTSLRMDLRYEWYRPRTFFPRAGQPQWNVLVLWVDDSFFEDDPLLRLPLLLEPLMDSTRLQTTNLPAVALIGPRRSSTLRAMLPGPLARTASMSAKNPSLWALAKKILQHVEIYCATPSAMDEVLVSATDYPSPRAAISNELCNTAGFKSFHNFTATDAQLAHEVFAELALGGTDLAEADNHVVLISESDTFYARVLSLTYAAELAVRQSEKTTNAISHRDFITGYVEGMNQMPENFHSFVYLRGLDGQTMGGNSETEGRAGNERKPKADLASFEELRNWTPDANKAEGRAQFDYLSRLGGQLAELQAQLHREDRGGIEAIGIVGSDVYDTLLILQALRPQFPDATFFTTDLDARFLSPREREWTRDMLVVSGFGLALHPDLQHEVAPFRDSAQTAQFAATLAALGDTNLLQLAFVPPRRFEIGSHAPVDLSVSNALLPVIDPAANTNSPWLHPLTVREAHRVHAGWNILLAFTILMAVLTTCWFWGPLRRLTVDGFRLPCLGLDYSEEDVGGQEGAKELLNQLHATTEPIFKPLKDEKVKIEKQFTEQHKSRREQDENSQEPAAELVTLLNRMQKREDFPAEDDEEAAQLFHDFPSARVRPWLFPAKFWRALRPFEKCYRTRRFLDACLDKLAAPLLALDADQIKVETSALLAAQSAREAAREIFLLRCQRLVWFWIGVVFFGALALWLGCAMWNDAFGRPDGEPFSLTNGASEWPAEILRLAVCAAAVGFSFKLHRRLREALFELTRKFRLSFSQSADRPHPTSILFLAKQIRATNPLQRKPLFAQLRHLIKQILLGQRPLFQKPDSATDVCALDIWRQYREESRLAQRVERIVLPMILCIVLCACIFGLFHQDPFDGVRGLTARWWNRSLICSSGFLFMALAFLTMDASRLCRRFILALNEGTTRYPEATRRYFQQQRGNINADYLSDWIDLQLIVELTERVGKLVYYPAGLLFVLLLARNGWWDTLSWPPVLIFVFAISLVLAMASVLILQHAAKDAKGAAEEHLATKVKTLQARTAPSPEQNDATQAKQLLDEIRELRGGAFAPFWQNPVVGAIFASSGGVTLLQIMIWLINR